VSEFRVLYNICITVKSGNYSDIVVFFFQFNSILILISDEFRVNKGGGVGDEQIEVIE
jgi:hypothetical protein